ncbi:MAG: glycosyltransferase family 4 protein [Halobacteriaceae archaeon]
MSLRVAFVTDVVYPFVRGGAQKRVHEIGRRLAARGHDVTVYGGHYWDGPPEHTHAGMTLRAVGPGRDLYAGDRRSVREALGFAWDVLPALRRRTGDHDVVDVSVFPYFPVLSARAATLAPSTPLVATWHEVWLDYWASYLGVAGLGGRLVERAVARVPQHPVAVSETTADRLARIGPPRESIAVVPNGVDVDRFRTATPDPDAPDVLFVGRLIPEKRVDRLLDAFDRVAADADARLGVVGDGPAADPLRERAAGMAHGDRVTFYGTYEGDLARLLAGARVYASASSREGFGITLVEAMAAGCSVVVADHPMSAARSVVGEGGFVVDPTVEALSEGLARALAGARPAADPVAVARRYDWGRVTDRAEAVYARATDRRAPETVTDREGEDAA